MPNAELGNVHYSTSFNKTTETKRTRKCQAKRMHCSQSGSKVEPKGGEAFTLVGGKAKRRAGMFRAAAQRTRRET